MRFSLFDKFGARNSVPVFAALRQAIESMGFKHTAHDMAADVAVIWSVLWAGNMRHNQAVWHHYRDQGKPVIVVEVGMLRRGHTWKLAVNGTGAYAFHGQGLDLNRLGKLALRASAWQQTGDRIMVCTQRAESLQWVTQPPIEQWLLDLRDRVRLYTQRPLVIRAHPRQKIKSVPGYTLDYPTKINGTYDDFDLDHALENSWAVINYNSGPGVQSIIKGIPAFVDASSLAAPVGNLDLANIEAPLMPDRSRWLLQIAHTEWTIPEIASGWPIQRLLLGLQSR